MYAQRSVDRSLHLHHAFRLQLCIADAHVQEWQNETGKKTRAHQDLCVRLQTACSLAGVTRSAGSVHVRRWQTTSTVGRCPPAGPPRPADPRKTKIVTGRTTRRSMPVGSGTTYGHHARTPWTRRHDQYIGMASIRRTGPLVNPLVARRRRLAIRSAAVQVAEHRDRCARRRGGGAGIMYHLVAQQAGLGDYSFCWPNQLEAQSVT
jgi:hypothetical protein